MKQIKRNTVS